MYISLRAPWQNKPYKNQTQNNTKIRRTPCRNRHVEKTILTFKNQDLDKNQHQHLVMYVIIDILYAKMI